MRDLISFVSVHFRAPPVSFVEPGYFPKWRSACFLMHSGSGTTGHCYYNIRQFEPPWVVVEMELFFPDETVTGNDHAHNDFAMTFSVRIYVTKARKPRNQTKSRRQAKPARTHSACVFPKAEWLCLHYCEMSQNIEICSENFGNIALWNSSIRNAASRGRTRKLSHWCSTAFFWYTAALKVGFKSVRLRRVFDVHFQHHLHRFDNLRRRHVKQSIQKIKRLHFRNPVAPKIWCNFVYRLPAVSGRSRSRHHVLFSQVLKNFQNFRRFHRKFWCHIAIQLKSVEIAGKCISSSKKSRNRIKINYKRRRYTSLNCQTSQRLSWTLHSLMCYLRMERASKKRTKTHLFPVFCLRASTDSNQTLYADRGYPSHFYRATACNATHGIALGILSVCLSVCPSDACIVTKLNDALRIFWYHMKRQSL